MRFQQLEPRHMAAVASIEICITDNTAEIWVEEFDRFHDGLRHVDMAIAWTGAQVDSVQITDRLPAFREVTTSPGRVELSAGSILIGYGNAGVPIGADGAELFATLHGDFSDDTFIEIESVRAVTVPTLVISQEDFRVTTSDHVDLTWVNDDFSCRMVR